MDIYLIAAIVATATYMFVIRELLDNISDSWRYWIGLETLEESLGFGDREVNYIPMEDIEEISLECDHHPALTLSNCWGCY
jgi:hypothetical protein